MRIPNFARNIYTTFPRGILGPFGMERERRSPIHWQVPLDKMRGLGIEEKLDTIMEEEPVIAPEPITMAAPMEEPESIQEVVSQIPEAVSQIVEIPEVVTQMDPEPEEILPVLEEAVPLVDIAVPAPAKKTKASIASAALKKSVATKVPNLKKKVDAKTVKKQPKTPAKARLVKVK